MTRTYSQMHRTDKYSEHVRDMTRTYSYKAYSQNVRITNVTTTLCPPLHPLHPPPCLSFVRGFYEISSIHVPICLNTIFSGLPHYFLHIFCRKLKLSKHIKGARPISFQENTFHNFWVFLGPKSIFSKSVN